jgi:TonB-linked SusC/RagA family outer membrane protein
MKNNTMLKRLFVFVLATFTMINVYAQTPIKGKVIDGVGDPLIGVSVFIKGSSVGTLTDVNGEFAFTIPASITTGVLVTSFIGFVTQEIPLDGRTDFQIVMKEDLETLDEVVVTGYVSEKKEKVTGAVAVVSADKISKVTVPSLDQALQGRVAGVNITQNTGAPGEGVSIRIRGVGSLNSGNYPLYIVDGVPILNINEFSLNDVENINILKDASATAVYGSRAANGVVVITTKSGSYSTVPKVEINSQFGFQQPSRLVDMLNTRDYITLYNEAATNDNVGKSGVFLRPLITEAIAATFSDVDHVDAIMQTALLQSHSFSVVGGEHNTSYSIGGNYFNQEGIVKSSAYERINARVNVQSKVKSWLTTGINLNLSHSITDFVPSSGDGAGGNGGSVVRYAFFRTPGIPIYDTNGDFVDLPSNQRFLGDGYNPVGMLKYNNNRKIQDQLFGRYFIKIDLTEGLSFNSNVGYTSLQSNRRRFDRNWGTANRINNPNRLNVESINNATITFSNYLTYDKTFSDVHNVSFLVGTESIANKIYVQSGSDNNLVDQDRNFTYLGLGQGLKNNSESDIKNSLLSYFGKVAYDFDNKYLASVTLRRDGSSRFGPSNRWGTFGAASLGWRLSREAFLQDVSWLDDLMLRVGYGRIGNQEIADFAYITLLSSGYNYPFTNNRSVGYGVSRLGNNDIKWEGSNQLNIGADMELWNGALSVSLDYFNKITNDLLVVQPLPPSAGDAQPSYVNNGKILNRGVELALTHAQVRGDFRYEVTGNVGWLKNEILEVDPAIPGGVYGSTNLTLAEKGHPIGSFYIYQMEGIFQNSADIFAHANQGQNIKPGDVMYKDINEDGYITAADRIHAGSPIPKFTAGLNISAGYKNWDLSLFFQGAYGQKILSIINRDIEGFYRPFNVTQRAFDNRWTGEGTSNTYPRASWDGSGNNTMFSTRFLEDGSYTRLKNLQIGYTLPKSLLERYGFSNVRIYASGINLLTFTKYGGMDPEMTVSDNALGEGDRSAGMDWGTYPSARSYNVGVSLTF